MWHVVFEYFDTTNSTERCFKAVNDAYGSPRCNFYLVIFCADFIEGVVRRPKIFSNEALFMWKWQVRIIEYLVLVLLLIIVISAG